MEKVDKGKGKERAEDGNVDGRKDRNEGGDRNRRVDGETLQWRNRNTVVSRTEKYIEKIV